MSDQTAKTELQVREVKSGPQVFIVVPTKKGTRDVPLNQSQLSRELAEVFAAAPKSLAGREVEYLMAGGQVQQVWEAGKQWDGSHQAPQRDKQRSGKHPDLGRPDRDHDAQHDRPPSEHTGEPGKFENPYNFIPVLPRTREHATLGDKRPAGHHRYHPDHWSGRIQMELTVKTPLLVPDLGRPGADGHKTFGLRTDERGHPILPPTSIKGALRSVYEAITNSRMGILEAHDERLALRMPAQEGVQLIPCRIVGGSNGTLSAELLPGLSDIGRDGRPRGRGEDAMMYAAWLHRYRKYNANARSEPDKHERQEALRYPDGRLPEHGDHVYVRVQPQPHRSRRFSFLSVREIRLAGGDTQCPNGWYVGYVFVSGPNIMNKHEERVFLLTPKRLALPLEQDHVRNWKRLIEDYQAIHRDEIEQRRQQHQGPSDYLGHEPGKTGFSRHVFAQDASNLNPGTLCYARIETDRNDRPVRIRALYPVSITRMLFDAPPIDRLSPSLRPADAPDALSPADRVFGWVNQQGHGSFKGQLRIGAVTSIDGAGAIERFDADTGVPLAILGQPKPAQARFYAARNSQGEPLPRGVEKKEAFREGGGLRGRKVYPHQRQAELPGYWEQSDAVSEPLQARLDNREVFREWLSHEGARTDQNRSITAWIKPEARFTFDIDITNLTDVEVGALLWLLRECETGHLRLGGGKPLGFGSVTLRAVALDLRDGAAAKADYTGFGSRANVGRRIGEAQQAEDVISAYQAALADAIGGGNSFDALPLIRALRHGLRGGNLPTHYPRTDQQRGPVGDSYKWFVKNEASDRNRHERYSLPDLAAEDRALLTLKESAG
jgi:CRISPR-associated protein (TIGR03986 family)